MGRLQKKTVLITGAGEGIGRAAALLFASEGAYVVIAEVAEDSGRKVRDAIVDGGGEAIFVRTDVTSEESVKGAIDATVKKYGRLDVIYNNAGGSTTADGPVATTSNDEFWRTIRLDLFGTWLTCRFGIPEMVKCGGGSVINTTSNASMMGIPRRAAYSAAKGGIVSLTRQMAVDYAPHNIRVNALAPSVTMTGRVVKMRNEMFDDETLKRLDAQMLLGPIEPEDVAYAALYLASDDSRVITGHVLPVDSGRLIS